MKLQELFLIETTEEDRAIISLSSAIYATIQQYVGIDENVDLGKIGDLYNTPLVALENISLKLHGTDDVLKALGITDQYEHISFGYWDSGDSSIVLNYDQLSAQRMKTTISHELRHALDDVKSDNKAGASDTYMTPKKKEHSKSTRYQYSATPAEINARFIEVLDVIAKRAPLWIEKVSPARARERLLTDLSHLLVKYEIAELFPEKTKSSDYKRLLKRAADFIDKELKGLGATITPGQLTA